MDAIKFNQLLKNMKYDKKAVGEIYTEFHGELQKHIGSKFGKLIDEVDAAHDVFVKLMTLEEQPYIKNPRSWLYALADNYIVDLLRRKNIEVEFYDNLAEELQSERSILQEDMKQAMKFLDEDSQKILYLHFWERRELKDIATELNISYVNVRVKESRAYQILKKIL